VQNAAIFFLYFVSLFSDLMAFGNPFQTVAMAARRVPDNFCGGRSPFSRFLVILVLWGQINRLYYYYYDLPIMMTNPNIFEKIPFPACSADKKVSLMCRSQIDGLSITI
jgi:hypothetical protein